MAATINIVYLSLCLCCHEIVGVFKETINIEGLIEETFDCSVVCMPVLTLLSL